MNFRAENIRFSHTSRHEPFREVFRDLSLTISRGECVGMIGREGSGKTTLLNLLGGLVPPVSGRILIDGVDPHVGPRGRKETRQRIGFTFQFPEEQFLRQTVAEEFGDMLRLRGTSSSEIPGRMEEALALMGLDRREVAERSPFSLSLGESRRVALALILAIGPGAALLDEPTAGLDASGVACTLNALGALHERGVTVIVATHDINFLAEIAGRVLILGDGGIAEDGEAGEILTDGVTLANHGYGVPEAVSVAARLREQGRLDNRRVVRLKDLLESPGVSGPSASGDSRQSGCGEKGDG
jgi:energy-coupling factor transporter ATP-binding protein EcfA2